MNQSREEVLFPQDNFFYSGHRVLIRPFRADDLFQLYPQSAVAAILPTYRPWLGVDDLRAASERLQMLSGIDPPVEIEALVLHHPTGEPLGFLCLSAIDVSNRKAELSLGFFRGRGSRPALEALHWSIDTAFDRFDLYKMIFHVLPDNSRAVRLLQRFNVAQEAVLREEILGADGMRKDLLRFSLFREEWLAGPMRRMLQRSAPLRDTE